MATKTVVAKFILEKSKLGFMDFTIAQTAAICVPPPKIMGMSVEITSPAIPARVGSPTAPIACIASISSVSGLRPAFFNPSSTTFVFKS